MMGARRSKGNLKRVLDGSDTKSPASANSVKSLNQGRGQEITGVSIPSEGTIKGWEFGGEKRLACANVDGTLYAVQGDCPRCAFDLFKGDIVTDEAFAPDLPRIACPTCATTYSLRTGKHGPPLKRTGLSGFVSGLAKTATQTDEFNDAQVYTITLDPESGRLFCKDS
eukprot:CAMPEP_0184856242 /NCGR_PEP_ID=MMETSP0580-20130426/1412_1 /TAXON_ID=1118495 /ORGANISM="Dactyliosolen fragilissimus" /LENGTH=167 /DNA_ID=CAMNT_0027351135 /DNA_START=152 /DNA_END=655 /DNA_ORIENTATION=-